MAHPRQVALLGGSFNPPHVGHLMAAVYVRATLQVDEVWLMPSFHHPFGKQMEVFEHRVAMCRAMAADYAPWLTVSEVERDVPGDGRTVDTLEHLRAAMPDVQWHLVLGSDIVKDLPHWKAWDRVQQLARVTILHRAGYDEPGALGPPLAEVSSTEIRRAFAERRLPGDLVPRAVLDYAQAHHLFGL